MDAANIVRLDNILKQAHELWDMIEDDVAAASTVTAAAKRVRANSVRLEKVLKLYRKESVKYGLV